MFLYLLISAKTIFFEHRYIYIYMCVCVCVCMCVCVRVDNGVSVDFVGVDEKFVCVSLFFCPILCYICYTLAPAELSRDPHLISSPAKNFGLHSVFRLAWPSRQTPSPFSIHGANVENDLRRPNFYFVALHRPTVAHSHIPWEHVYDLSTGKSQTYRISWCKHDETFSLNGAIIIPIG